MRIGVLGPASLDLLDWPGRPPDTPRSYEAPVITHLVNGLLRRGHQVVLFTASPGATAPWTWTEGGLTICAARWRGRRMARDLFRTERNDLAELLARFPTEILHAHWSYEFALAALQSGRPCLVTLHDHAATVLRHSPDPYRAVRLAVDRWVKRRALRLTVNSPYMMDLLPNEIRRKASIVPDCYDPRSLPAAVDDRHRRNVIVSIANGLSHRKNVEAALAACAMLAAEGVDHRLELMGADMQPGGPAMDLAMRKGWAETVSFLGPLDHTATLERVASAALMLHPSREESFGMALLEAMALGTTALAGARSGNVPHLLGGGRYGALCDVEDHDDVAAAVAALLADEDLRGCLARRGRAHAKAHFSETVVVDQFVALYEDVLAQEGRLP